MFLGIVFIQYWSNRPTICALRFLSSLWIFGNVVIFIRLTRMIYWNAYYVVFSSLFSHCLEDARCRRCYYYCCCFFFVRLLILYLIFANTRNLVYRIEYCWFSFFFSLLFFSSLFFLFIFFCVWMCVYEVFGLRFNCEGVTHYFSG